MSSITAICERIAHTRFRLEDEKALQVEIARIISDMGVEARREVRCCGGVIDIHIPSFKTGIEIKTKGTERAVIRQIRKYSDDERFDQIVVVTGKTFDLPAKVGSRQLPVININLARAWL